MSHLAAKPPQDAPSGPVMDQAQPPARPVRTSNRSRRQAQFYERVATIASPFLLLAIWELVSRLQWVDVRFFPPPSLIALTFWELATDGTLMTNTAVSMTRVVLGFLLGAIPAVLVGLTMGLFPLFRAAAKSFIAITYPIPKIAILPLILLIFGLGETSKYVIIAIAVFFPVAINTMAGVLGIEKIYIDVGRNFGADKLTFYTAIALPGAMATVLAGLRIAWSTALLLIVAAEFVGANSGLGAMIWNSWQIFAIEDMYVGLIVMALLGYVSFMLLDWIEHRVVPWKAAQH